MFQILDLSNKYLMSYLGFATFKVTHMKAHDAIKAGDAGELTHEI